MPQRQGDGKERGLNRLAHKGLIKRVVGGHWSLVPKLGELALNNEIEAYNLPLGCISHLYREIAARRPGTISKVGLRTFVDPREQGGKLNSVTTEDLVELHRDRRRGMAALQGLPDQRRVHPRHHLRSERQHHDGARGAHAGQSRRRHGGEELARLRDRAGRAHRRRDSLNPREVQVPGILVDCVVLAEAKNHLQTYGTPYNHAFSGRQRVPLDRIEPMELDERKIIARRCAFELPLGGVVNLGIGMPEGVAAVAAEERILKYVTLTAEPGIVGGIPQGGLDFGAALNPEAVIQQNQQFDFYDGGGLDLACLGMAQADAMETSMSAGSDAGSPAPAASSTSRRTPRSFCSRARSRPAASRSKSRTASLSLRAKAGRRSSSSKVEQITFSGALRG